MHRELCLLALLRQNARMSLADMARTLGWPLSTTFAVHRRVAPLVLRYTSLFDLQRLFALRLVYVCSPLAHQEAEFLAYVKKHESVNTLFACSARQYVMECVFSELGKQHEFEQQLRCPFHVHPVLEECARENFLARYEEST